MSDSAALTAARVPTVYFIDDSATMREVIKIAFRKENVNVITCPDAASALAQFNESAPDAVITDVIMPDKDGYEVCDFIKHHEQFRATPVILMSGVVNKTVAEKATAVKADELIRKPFHPQDLISRVRGLLASKFPPAPSSASAAAPPVPSSSQVLTKFFAPAPTAPIPIATPEPRSVPFANPSMRVVPPPATANTGAPQSTAGSSASPSPEVQKLRNEVRRLELLIKKLQTELEASREYCASLETEIKTQQG